MEYAIQKQVADPLAQKILAGKFKEGDHIVVDVSHRRGWGAIQAGEQTEDSGESWRTYRL